MPRLITETLFRHPEKQTKISFLKPAIALNYPPRCCFPATVQCHRRHPYLSPPLSLHEHLPPDSCYKTMNSNYSLPHYPSLTASRGPPRLWPRLAITSLSSLPSPSPACLTVLIVNSLQHLWFRFLGLWLSFPLPQPWSLGPTLLGLLPSSRPLMLAPPIPFPITAPNSISNFPNAL